MAMRADERFRSIPNMALMAAETFGAEPSVVDGEATLSFRDVATAMTTVGRALMASGVRPGDRVGVWAPNSAVWIEAALGALAVGAWLVPINTRFKGDEAAYVVTKAGIRFLFSVEVFLGVDYPAMLRGSLATAQEAAPEMVSVPGPGTASSPSWAEFLARAGAENEDAVLERIHRLGPDDVSDVIFTSGTTGMPKGVMLRHGASLRGYESFNRGVGLAAGDRHAIVVPFFHCFGYKAGWMLDRMMGATTYPLAVYDPESLMGLVQKERITHLDGPPTLFTSMLDHPHYQDYDLSSLRSGTVSAAAVPAELITRLRQDVGMGAMSGYGLTECHALVSVAHPEDPPELIAGTVGHPLPDIDVQVVDADGHPVAAGETGEIVVRGYNLMSGYFADPQATVSVVVDGWLRTGDIGVLDEQGYLRITDRKKDIYVTGGFNVSPVEVEKTLLRFDKIGEVAVVGTADQRLGEIGVAFVVAKPGVELSAEEVAAYAGEHLANFKVPRRVRVVGDLPRNATGKVVKPELRRLAENEPH
jgi:acyl-CoA synthetase (AMP-forming)/AMP-acid ligase II